jgi:hypothetical protein
MQYGTVPWWDRRMSDSLPARIGQYYATVPLLFADANATATANEIGSLRPFVRRRPGASYYGGPRRAQPTAASAPFPLPAA